MIEAAGVDSRRSTDAALFSPLSRLSCAYRLAGVDATAIRLPSPPPPSEPTLSSVVGLVECDWPVAAERKVRTSEAPLDVCSEAGIERAVECGEMGRMEASWRVSARRSDNAVASCAIAARRARPSAQTTDLVGAGVILGAAGRVE